MIGSVDPLLHRRFDRRRYDCLHFARDVWLELTGEDLAARLDGLLAAPEDRHVLARHRRAFQRLPGPREPCLVVGQRRHSAPHVGVFLRGRVLHLREEGATFQTFADAMRGFTSVRCYA